MRVFGVILSIVLATCFLLKPLPSYFRRGLSLQPRVGSCGVVPEHVPLPDRGVVLLPALYHLILLADHVVRSLGELIAVSVGAGSADDPKKIPPYGDTPTEPRKSQQSRTTPPKAYIGNERSAG